jgi:Uma2 family endonuclease
VSWLNNTLVPKVTGRAQVSVQGPVRLSAISEPEPDLAVLLPRADSYRHAHPTPGDVLLVVEVAVSSLRFDLDEKLPLYARSGIREAWVVDLVGREVTVATKPGTEGYADVRTLHDGDRLTVLDVDLDVTALLGPARA